MVDAVRGAPTRVPPDFPSLFAAPPGGFEPHRVALPATPSEAHRTAISVRRADLDPMGHANNGVYLDWAEDAVATTEGGHQAIEHVPRTWTLEYLAPAGPGDVVSAAAWPGPPGTGTASVRLERAGMDVLRGRFESG
jgi:acyl-ACP thioesterase